MSGKLTAILTGAVHVTVFPLVRVMMKMMNKEKRKEIFVKKVASQNFLVKPVTFGDVKTCLDQGTIMYHFAQLNSFYYC